MIINRTATSPVAPVSYVRGKFLIMKLLTAIWGLFFVLSLEARAQEVQPRPFTKGVYGDAGAFIRNGMTLSSLGVNAIFVHRGTLKETLYQAARSEGVRIYVEFPLLNGREYLETHPEAWPIDEKGERAPEADWFMGICLTDPGFRRYREDQLNDLLDTYQVDGLWLDYLHWHAQFETPDPILPETCFCDRCLAQFQRDMKVDIPPGTVAEKSQWIRSMADPAWRLWRSNVLNDWVSDMKAILKSRQPSALLGIYYCPWYPEDFEGAHYRILGLNMDALADIAEVFSPMLYHRMMGRSPAWVGEYIQWLDETVIRNRPAPLIWPIVQAHNKPGAIAAEEFSQVMQLGSRPPASGIMMFTLHSLISEPLKLERMRDLYRKR